MSASCAHEHLRTVCVVERIVEYGETRIANVTIRCEDCGATARWRVPGGLAPNQAMASPFGEELRAPFVWAQPGDEG